jgi:hypothetical protein
MELRSKGTDLFAWSRFGEESNIGYIFVFRAGKGTDLFKLELKSILNKSVPFFVHGARHVGWESMSKGQ